jgi:hypothetical protein
VAISDVLTSKYFVLPAHYSVMQGMFVPKSSFVLANQTLTRDVAGMAVLCDAIDTCTGFSADGWLFNSNTFTRQANSTLYVKK